MKPQYVVKKQTPSLKKGAILEVHGCYDNGAYGYKCENKACITDKKQDAVHYYKGTVEKQPQWFEKIKLLWLTDNQYKKIKKFLKLKR